MVKEKKRKRMSANQKGKKKKKKIFKEKEPGIEREKTKRKGIRCRTCSKLVKKEQKIA